MTIFKFSCHIERIGRLYNLPCMMYINIRPLESYIYRELICMGRYDKVLNF